VRIDGNTHTIEFQPASSNTMTATGDFTAAKGMKVIVTTNKVGAQSFQARLKPLHGPVASGMRTARSAALLPQPWLRCKSAHFRAVRKSNATRARPAD
jgi:hypothetical protein